VTASLPARVRKFHEFSAPRLKISIGGNSDRWLDHAFALKIPKLMVEPAQLRTSIAKRLGSGLS